MQISAWCRTDKGLRRDSNQDSFLVNRSAGLFIVADGMGGHSGGEVASALAVATAEEYILKNRYTQILPHDLLTNAYKEASHHIYDRALQDTKLAGMGTTMVLAYFKDNSMFIANVGDSRVYLYHKPHLWQLTEDHSLLNEQLKAGILNETQAKSFTSRNVITRSVGYERDVVVDIIERPLSVGDQFLLCSDGLSSLVPDTVTNEILNYCSPDQTPNLCVERALAYGGDDNVTVMLLEVTG